MIWTRIVRRQGVSVWVYELDNTCCRRVKGGPLFCYRDLSQIAWASSGFRLTSVNDRGPLQDRWSLVQLQVKQHSLIVCGTWGLESSLSAPLASYRLAMLGAMRAACVWRLSSHQAQDPLKRARFVDANFLVKWCPVNW